MDLCGLSRQAVISRSGDDILHGWWEGSNDACVSCLSLVDMHNDNRDGSSICCYKVTCNWRDIKDVVVFVECNNTFYIPMLHLEVRFPGDVDFVLVLFRIIAKSLGTVLVPEVLL